MYKNKIELDKKYTAGGVTFQGVTVYNLKNSIIQSGYPMLVFNQNSISANRDLTEKDIKRAKILLNAKSGSGHDCFLKGINVSFDLTAPAYFWQQFQRYHFQDIVSSQSKMHKLLDMDIEKHLTDNVKEGAKAIIRDCIVEYKKGLIDLETVLDNLPMGFLLTAGITTNYLQLKSQYYQRKTHKLKGWSEAFVRMFRDLPLLKEVDFR